MWGKKNVSSTFCESELLPPTKRIFSHKILEEHPSLLLAFPVFLTEIQVPDARSKINTAKEHTPNRIREQIYGAFWVSKNNLALFPWMKENKEGASWTIQLLSAHQSQWVINASQGCYFLWLWRQSPLIQGHQVGAGLQKPFSTLRLNPPLHPHPFHSPHPCPLQGWTVLRPGWCFPSSGSQRAEPLGTSQAKPSRSLGVLKSAEVCSSVLGQALLSSHTQPIIFFCSSSGVRQLLGGDASVCISSK